MNTKLLILAPHTNISDPFLALEIHDFDLIKRSYENANSEIELGDLCNLHLRKGETITVKKIEDERTFIDFVQDIRDRYLGVNNTPTAGHHAFVWEGDAAYVKSMYKQVLDDLFLR